MRIIAPFAITHCCYEIYKLLPEKSGLAVRNPTLTKIVRGQFYGHAVAGYNSDKMFPHLPSNVSYNLVAVFKLYSKLSPWKGLDDNTAQFDYFFTSSHRYNKG